MHADGAAALFAACERAAVRRVIHFSAIGVDRAAPTDFSRTKIEGDYPELLYRWGHSLYDGTVLLNCPITNINSPCAGDSIVAFQLLNDPALTVLDRGHRTALSLGVSGGSAALTYAVTGSYGDEVGLVKLPTYEVDRYQARLGVAPPDWMQRPQHLTQWGVTSRVSARLGANAEVSLQAIRDVLTSVRTGAPVAQ